MNKTIQNVKIDHKSLAILSYLAKYPNNQVTTDHIFKKMKELGWKTNYPAIFRKVDSLIEQNFILKEKYGIANKLRLNLEDERTIALLSLDEAIKKDRFIESISGSLKVNLYNILKDIEANSSVISVLVFGSYAKNKQRADSDLDLLIIFNNYKMDDNKQNRFKNDILGILKTAELRSNIQINPIIVNSEEFNEMLSDDNENIGKESLLDHIILSGADQYWRQISKCCQKTS